MKAIEMTPQLAEELRGIVTNVEGMVISFKTKCALSGLPPTKAVFFAYLDGMKRRRPDIFTDDTLSVIKIVIDTYKFI